MATCLVIMAMVLYMSVKSPCQESNCSDLREYSRSNHATNRRREERAERKTF